MIPWLRLLAVLPLLGVGRGVAAPLPQAAGQWVTVAGGHLVYNGQPVRLKGVSFYPKKEPWATMWTAWNGPDTQADLQGMALVGGNVVRILLPYRKDETILDATRGDGTIDPVLLDRVRQMVQLAGQQHMKVLLTLFDFYDDTPAADDPRWAQNVVYLQSLLGAFADDDRVLGYDLHNEPDLYSSWTDRPDAALDWFLRVGALVHQLAPRQLVTVGVAHPDALWRADAQGRTLLSTVDFVSFHSYDAGAILKEITAVRAHTDKPVVLQETGWPTGPCGLNPDYNEQHQVILYHLMTAAAQTAGLDGLLAWTLWDFPPTSSSGGGVESEQDYFGLLRLDGSLKPGGGIYRDQYQDGVLPLDSVATSALPLTIAPPPPPSPPPPGWIPPIYFPETKHDIRDVFRDYWKQFGGLEVFGYPITQPWVEDGRLVQYFERARFEAHPENRRLPGFNALDLAGQLRLEVQLTRYGATLTAQRNFAPATPPAPDQAAVRWFPQTQHRLGGAFRQFWERHAGLTNFGYPLSEELQEVSPLDGKPYTVQYFERVRMEYHPEYAGTPYEVELGQLGTEDLRSRGCG